MEKEKNKKKYCSEKGCPRGKLYATNWLEGISDCRDNNIVEVTFKNTRVGFYTNPSELELNIGDIVAVEGNPGHDIGRVSMVGRLVRQQMRKNGVKADPELKKVFRHATQADMEKFEEARSKEHSTMIKTRKIAEDLGLDMKIGDVEYQGDGGKAIFYYIADERVDFRKLIRILADTFKVRVEMKQIGARQEAGRIGGLGACGRELCCSSWMSSFSSVTTGAARVQEISLNPQKLAGQCSKLKCCMMYEYDAYVDARKEFPRLREPLQTQEGEWFLFKSDVLAGTMTFSSSKETMSNVTVLPVARVKEILSLNRQGECPERLLPEGMQSVAAEEPTYRSEEDSITRFDQAKRRRKNNRNRRQENPRQEERQGERRNRPAAAEGTEQGSRPERRPRSEGEQRSNRPNRRPRQQGEQQVDRRTPQNGERTPRENNRENRPPRENREGSPREQQGSREGGNRRNNNRRRGNTSRGSNGEEGGNTAPRNPQHDK